MWKKSVLLPFPYAVCTLSSSSLFQQSWVRQCQWWTPESRRSRKTCCSFGLLWPCRNCHSYHLQDGQEHLCQVPAKEKLGQFQDEAGNTSSWNRQVSIQFLFFSISRPTREDPAFTKMVDLCENHYYTGKMWRKKKKYMFSHQSSSGSLTMVQRRAFGKTAGTMMGNIPLRAWIPHLIMNTRSMTFQMFLGNLFFSQGGLKLLVWVDHEDLEAVDPPDFHRWKSARMAALLFHEGYKPGCFDCPAGPRESNHHHPRGGSTLQERLPLHWCPGEKVKNF